MWRFFFFCGFTCLSVAARKQLKGADDVIKSHTIHAVLLTLTGAFGDDTTHLDEGVDYTNIGTGIEDLVEARLSVDQLQLVELLVIL